MGWPDLPPTVTARLLERCREPERPWCHVKSVGGDYRTFTYGEFFRGAAGFARAYRERGVRAGDIVVIILDHGPKLIFAFTGAILAGAIPSLLPVPSRKITPAYFDYVISNLTAVISPALLVGRGGAPAAAAGRSWLAVDTVPAAADPGPIPAPAPDDMLLLQHSSGTTGLQKGVALTHRAVMTHLAAYGRALALTPEDVVGSWLPLYHDMGLVACFLLPLLTGVPLAMMSPFEWISRPGELLRLVTRFRVTLVWLPNFAFEVMTRMVREEDGAGCDLASVRMAINCSEPVVHDSMRAFADRYAARGLRPSALAACYAMAENTFAVTQTPPGAPPATISVDRDRFLREGIAVPAAGAAPARTCVSSGVPIDGCEVRIVADDGRDRADGQLGEIALRSPAMLREYFRRPDATAAAVRDGWYFTGDIGFRRDGELYVVGRRKELIIVGGQNFYPADLEAIVNRIPGIKPGRAAAIGAPNPLLGTEEIVVVAETEVPPDDAARDRIVRELKTAVFGTIGCPVTRVVLTDPGRLQKSTSGKLARGVIRDRYLAGEYT